MPADHAVCRGSVRVRTGRLRVEISGSAYSFPNSHVAGNAIVVAASWGGTGTPTISDRRGNRYTLARMQTDGRFSVGVWAAFDIAAGPNSVTLTLSGQRFDATYMEYSGLASLDQVAGASGSNVAPHSSATPATTSANEMVFGFASRNYPDLTAGEGFTVRASGTRNRSVMAEDKRVTSTGAQTAPTCPSERPRTQRPATPSWR